jgi:dihydroorotate dehydrogenase (fumarate)
LIEVGRWLDEHEFSSVEQLKGSMSRRHSSESGVLERANYMQALINYSAQHPVPYLD